MLRASLVLALLLSPVAADAAPDEPYWNPHFTPPAGPKEVDLSKAPPIAAQEDDQAPRFDELDDFVGTESPPDPNHVGRLPDGWVQRGNVVMPIEVANGFRQLPPRPPKAFEDIPGNKYPRKHTLYMNFTGGMLYSTLSGKDISAESISTLAVDGVYPTYTGGEQKAIAAAQAVENDLAAYGVRVVYLERPPKVLPYTMAMIGGTWQDTNLDSPAGGVAPTADCGALNQRHIVYVFSGGGDSATTVANVTSQEAGHAWGLDHTLNCSSVMSYCGGFGDKVFSDTCDDLCEEQCQGANSIGCRLAHEEICGEGSNAQNEAAELQYLFGGNEPDMSPPVVEIVEPMDGEQLEAPADVDLRAIVDDDYGGMGWQITIEHDGEVLYDEVDYFKENVDLEFRAALNLSALDPGTYVITVLAMDHADQTTEDTVTFVVTGEGGATAGSGESGGTSGTMTTGVDTGDTTVGTGDTTALGDGGDELGDRKGCDCATGSSSPPSIWPGLLALVFVRRGRRVVQLAQRSTTRPT